MIDLRQYLKPAYSYPKYFDPTVMIVLMGGIGYKLGNGEEIIGVLFGCWRQCDGCSRVEWVTCRWSRKEDKENKEDELEELILCPWSLNGYPIFQAVHNRLTNREKYDILDVRRRKKMVDLIIKHVNLL